MRNDAASVSEYLASLPDDRRVVISAVRDVIVSHLPEGYAEGMQYGMIGYYVPHEIYPPGYHSNPKQPLPFAALAAQKTHMALYLMSVYGDPEQERWFREAWTSTGKKLDMGKSCVRFKGLDDVPLEVVGRAISRVPVRTYIERYEATLGGARKKAGPTKPSSAGSGSGKAVSPDRKPAGTARATKSK